MTRNVLYKIPALALLLLWSCTKDTIVVEEKPNPQVVVDFKAVVKSAALVPNTQWYTNASLDSFTVTKFNYYISNIKLVREDGSVYTEPESYHLIKHVEGLTTFTLNDVPEGNYTRMDFLIGVDSTRNVSGAQTGALDPANQMFWEWNTGYIFYKMEGAFNTLSQPVKGDYAIHIGGFTGKYSCLQKGSVLLNSNLKPKKGSASTIRINTHVEEVFTKPVTIGFDDYYSAIGNPMFKSLSENYKDMFELAGIDNP